MAMPLEHSGQTIRNGFIEIELGQFANPDYRYCLLSSIATDDNISYIIDENNSSVLLSSVDGWTDEQFQTYYDELKTNAETEFETYLASNKETQGMYFSRWKETLPKDVFVLIFRQVMIENPRGRDGNQTCATAEPFCTTDVVTFHVEADPGGVCETGPDYGCFVSPGWYDYSQRPPFWYYMKIGIAGTFTIEMSNSEDIDIDYCCWGPFSDPVSPCPNQLTGNKIVDCSASVSGTELCEMPSTTQVGEYYLLVITKYNQTFATDITFQKVLGSGLGETDCGILPGYANNTGPYCVGQTIQLSINEQEGASYSWTGPNNFSSSLREPTLTNCTLGMAGEYTCTVTVDTLSVTGTTLVEVFPQPTASFTSDVVCSGTPTHFTNTSITNPTGQNITSYQWSFGDGGTSTQANPTHTYAQGGTYQATLTVGCGGNCTDQITQTVTVYAAPTANAGPDQNIPYNSSTQLNGTGGTGNFTYSWSPANMINGSANIANPQTVSLTDTQTYTLTVTNPDHPECNSTDEVIVYIQGGALGATASASPSTICAGNSTQLSVSVGGGLGSSTFSWSPTTGLSNPNIQNPMASPTQTTTYTCTVSNAQTSQTVTTSVTVTVNPSPVANFNATTVCAGSPTQFTNTSTGSGITSYQWNFGDGGTSTQANPTHTYAQAGTYTATLTVGNGICEHTASKTVTVNATPSASFTATSVCAGHPTEFNNTSTGSGITSYQWNFGDNSSPSNQQHPTHTYSQPGNYFVTLTVSAGTCTDQYTMPVAVFAQPTANFSATTVCSGTPTEFTSNSSGGDITSYEWNFGDGHTGSGQNASHTYDQGGIYHVTLTVGNGHCEDQITLPVTVNDTPIAEFDATTVCAGTPTQFTSRAIGQGITSYEWHFDDGHTGSGQSTTHTFAQAGTYNVTHIVSTANGECSNSVTMPVVVNAMPTANAGESQTIEYGNIAHLSGSGGSGTFDYHWEPADKVLDPNAQNTQTVALTATQVFTLTVSNPQNQQCTDQAQTTIFINGSAMSVTASPDVSICQGGSTVIHAIAGGGSGHFTYLWTPATGLSNPNIASPTASPMQTTTYTCHVSDGQTSQNVSVTVSVNDIIVEYEFASICPGESYSWNGATYYQPGTYTYTTVTPEGCEKTVYLNLDNFPSYDETVTNADICHGETYLFEGQFYDITGHYADTLQTVNGCDSIVRLNLTVLPENELIIDQISICESQNLFWHGNYYNQDGAEAYFDTIDAHGCPLRYKLELSVGQYQTGAHTTAYECYPHGGTPYYVWEIPEQNWSRPYNKDFPNGIQDEVILPDPAGECDIKYTLDLHFLETPEVIHTTETVCNSYQWFVEGQLVGEYFDTTEEAFHIPMTPFPCDQVYQLHLTVNHQSVDNEMTIDCNTLQEPACDIYPFFDPNVGETVYFNKDTDTVLTGKTPDGCNYKLHLHLLNLKHKPDPWISACASSTHEFGLPEDPQLPDTAMCAAVVTNTEFFSFQYTFEMKDLGRSIWDECKWTISKPTWRIVPQRNPSPAAVPSDTTERFCTVYVADRDDNYVVLTGTAKNSCDSVTVRYYLKSSFLDVVETEAYPAAVSIAPNPNRGNMQLRFENMAGHLRIDVRNVTGIMVDSFEVATQHTGETYDYTMRRLPEGVYFITVGDGKRSITKKVVIIR